jgi:leucyl-tRNA synthetase
MPIDLYVGGISHATGHLIYFRFFHKFLADIGWVQGIEPATRLFNHGMVADANGEVMSKSKGNVVSPIDLMDTRGIDISRLAMFFTAPSEKPVMWSNETITGVEKFASGKLYDLAAHYRGSNVDLNQCFKLSDLTVDERVIYVKLNQTIKRVSESFERLQFNTAIAALMELVRDYEPAKIASDELNDFVVLRTIQMIAPLAPHLAEEMWELTGAAAVTGGSVFKSRWPEYDPEAGLVEDEGHDGPHEDGADEDEDPVDGVGNADDLDGFSQEAPDVDSQREIAPGPFDHFRDDVGQPEGEQQFVHMPVDVDATQQEALDEGADHEQQDRADHQGEPELVRRL